MTPPVVDLSGRPPAAGRLASLVDALVAGRALAGPPALEALARATPAGAVDLPLAVVTLAEGVEATQRVDRAWLDALDRRRAAARTAVVAAGREQELEAALQVAMVVATERFDPADDADVDAHVASGACLWLVTGAVASAVAGTSPDPFRSWARLVAAGWWPVGPSGGRLVVSTRDHAGAAVGPGASAP